MSSVKNTSIQIPLLKGNKKLPRVRKSPQVDLKSSLLDYERQFQELAIIVEPIKIKFPDNCSAGTEYEIKVPDNLNLLEASKFKSAVPKIVVCPVFGIDKNHTVLFLRKGTPEEKTKYKNLVKIIEVEQKKYDSYFSGHSSYEPPTFEDVRPKQGDAIGGRCTKKRRHGSKRKTKRKTKRRRKHRRKKTKRKSCRKKKTKRSRRRKR